MSSLIEPDLMNDRIDSRVIYLLQERVKYSNDRSQSWTGKLKECNQWWQHIEFDHLVEHAHFPIRSKQEEEKIVEESSSIYFQLWLLEKYRSNILTCAFDFPSSILLKRSTRIELIPDSIKHWYTNEHNSVMFLDDDPTNCCIVLKISKRRKKNRTIEIIFIDEFHRTQNHQSCIDNRSITKIHFGQQRKNSR